MKITEADIVWNTDSVRVERHGSGYELAPGDLWMPATGLGAYGFPAKNPVRQLLEMFVLFNTLVVRDRVPVDTAHQAFLQIDEYRQAIARGR
jgi:hypothetical protein